MLSLSTVLKINAVSSGVTGLALVLFAKTTAAIFDVSPTTPFIAVGVFLVLFALFVFGTSANKPVNEQVVKTIIALDTMWVIASIVAIFWLAPAISLIGTFIIAGVALWVAAMAYLQKRGLQSTHVENNSIQKFGIQ